MLSLKKQDKRLFLITGMGFLTAHIFIYCFKVDYLLADLLFQLEGGHWALRRTWFFKQLLHDDAKKIVRLFPLFFLGLLIASYHRSNLIIYRRGFLFLFITPLISVSLISTLKYNSGTYCPAALTRYGGDILLSENLWGLHKLGDRGCTPAGHSSGGYTWIALFFFARAYFPNKQFVSLLPGLLLGIIMGGAQQLRGEHFISHDLWTLMLCWYTSFVSYLVFFRKTNHSLLRNLRE